VVEEGAEQRDARRHQLEVGAHVGREVGPHGGDVALGVGRQLHVLDLAPALDGGDGVLAAPLGPAGGLAPAAGHRHRDELLGVDVELGAEAPAHRRRHDPQLVLGHAGGGGEHHLEDVGDLGGRVDGHVAAVHAGHHGHAPGLHGLGDEPLLDVGLADRVGGAGEGGLDRVGVGREGPGVGLVGTQAVVDHDPVGGGVGQVGDRLQRLVVHDHGVDPVGRRVAAVGHDHGHDVADVAGLVGGDRVVVRGLHVRGHRPGAGHGGDPGVGQVAGGQDLVDAVHLEGGAGVDAADAGVGVGAAHHAQPHGAGDREVVHEAGLAGEQPGVLLAEQALAEGTGGGRGVGGGHAGTPPSAAASTALTMLW
jgi:hypothetical protein